MSPTIDYSSVQPGDLEMKREPRKATITVEHKPTKTVASDPVCPGSLQPARFRRAANLPADHRVKGMEGYIEAADPEAEGLWRIFGDNAADDLKGKNEYVIALAGDADALKASFEGTPTKTKSTPKAKDETKTDPESGAKTPAGAPAAATPEPPAPAADPVDASEIDELLADIDAS